MRGTIGGEEGGRALGGKEGGSRGRRRGVREATKRAQLRVEGEASLLERAAAGPATAHAAHRRVARQQPCAVRVPRVADLLLCAVPHSKARQQCTYPSGTRVRAVRVCCMALTHRLCVQRGEWSRSGQSAAVIRGMSVIVDGLL